MTAEKLTATNSLVHLAMDPAPETTGMILVPETARNIPRIGTVTSVGPFCSLNEGDRVVCSLYGRTEYEGVTIIDESAIYCRLNGNDLEAFAGRLILLLDPKPEDVIGRTEDSIKKQVLLSGKNPLRKATVLSSGLEDYPEGARVLVAFDIYDCLQVLPNDKDLPFIEVPENQEIRIYKPDLETIQVQVPIVLED